MRSTRRHRALEPRPRGGARRAARGAIFRGSDRGDHRALTLGLLGLRYVHELLQLKQLGAMRLGRAAVIAHSMAGCEANQARDWLGKIWPVHVQKPIMGRASGARQDSGAELQRARRRQQLCSSARAQPAAMQ